MFESQSRDQLRLAYINAWSKYQRGLPLEPLEAQIAAVIERHPEYQPLVRDAARALDHTPMAGGGVQNPFLHMGLHMALHEQVTTDRPAGIRTLHKRLQERFGEHAGEHILMEALNEILWQAQRDGVTPDEARYLSLAQSRLSR